MAGSTNSLKAKSPSSPASAGNSAAAAPPRPFQEKRPFLRISSLLGRAPSCAVAEPVPTGTDHEPPTPSTKETRRFCRRSASRRMAWERIGGQDDEDGAAVRARSLVALDGLGLSDGGRPGRNGGSRRRLGGPRRSDGIRRRRLVGIRIAGIGRPGLRDALEGGVVPRPRADHARVAFDPDPQRRTLEDVGPIRLGDSAVIEDFRGRGKLYPDLPPDRIDEDAEAQREIIEVDSVIVEHFLEVLRPPGAGEDQVHATGKGLFRRDDDRRPFLGLVVQAQGIAEDVALRAVFREHPVP